MKGRLNNMMMSVSKRIRSTRGFIVGEMKIEGVSCFRFLGTIIFNNNNVMSIGINERILAYQGNQQLFRDQPIKRNTKLKI